MPWPMGGPTVGGGVQWDDNANYDVFSDGEWGKLDTPKPGFLDQLACHLTATAYARPDNCTAPSSRDIILSSVAAGMVTAGGNYMSGCRTYQCLGGSFLYGFNVAIWGQVFYLAWYCYFWN